MSWIGGEFILNDVKKKDLDAAADRIRYAVRSNANLAFVMIRILNRVFLLL